MEKHLLFLAMILLPMVASAHDIEVANDDGITIYYNYTNDGKELAVTVRGRNYDDYSNEYTGNVVIPEEVTYMNRTRKVTSIGWSAFNGCTGLTSVTIPNSVTSIGGYAFYDCSKLTSITIPNSVTSIGSYAFQNCTGLTSIIISNNLTQIEHETFKGCSKLTSITIPNSVTWIAYKAFYGCSKLASITIPNSVTSIGDGAFYGCSELKKVIVSDIAAWCGIVFSKSDNNPLYYAGHLYSDENTEITDLVIPNSVTNIGTNAFYGCKGLTSVTIPNSVTSIGEYAFWCCKGLTSVTIPNSVTSIGSRAFSGCGLTSVTIGNSVTSIGGSAFSGANIPIIISLIENPFTINGKTTDYSTFSLNTFNNATLYVPVGTIDKYKATNGWKDFLFIEEGTGPNGGEETPSTPQKCENPVISYENGKLSFSCATDGVEFVSEIVSDDTKKHYGNEISLTTTYTVSVYATKEGYENSDVVTKNITFSGNQAGDLNGDGEINITDVTLVLDIINQK